MYMYYDHAVKGAIRTEYIYSMHMADRTLSTFGEACSGLTCMYMYVQTTQHQKEVLIYNYACANQSHAQARRPEHSEIDLINISSAAHIKG